MTKLLVKEKYTKIIEEDDVDFLKKLHNHLSFKYENAEFMWQYKKGWWDGMEYLLSKKLEFYSGLVNYVEKFYKENNKELEIVNCKKPITNASSIDISHNLKKLKLEPYDYQLSAVEYSLDKDRAIFKHATGSGKSLTAALITAKFGKPTLLMVISKELLHQFHSFFSLLFDQEIGIVGDGICEVNNITIASVWTLGKALGIKPKELLLDDSGSSEKFDKNNTEKILDCMKQAKIIHLDECHVASAKTIRSIYKVIEPERLFSFSGTPSRDDGSDLILTGILGSNIHEVKASELIKRGILSKPMIKFLYVKGFCKYDAPYPTVYSDHVVNNEYRNKLLVSETIKLINKGYQVLVLFKTIQHGKILLKMFQDAGIETEFLSGKDTVKKRAEVKDNLLSKRSMCVVASMIYDIGVNIETLSGLVLAGSGKSSVKTLQRIGRVLRDGKNKPYVAVIETLDNVKFLKKHSLIRKSIYETEPEFVIKMPELKKK